MGADSGNGHLVIDRNNYLILKDDYDLNQEVYDLMILAMQQFAEEIGKDGKDSLMIPLWGKGNKLQFLHILSVDVLWEMMPQMEL